ncbi:MAG: FmdB family transcriptional regulator [Acidimicrobiia bacterium]|nr:FmdB family transcriptional regulator [Acidimicrobiia bacterium]MDH3462690.1 FmdB family transcriptional regulator [Acidimicrobiia bacterium]
MPTYEYNCKECLENFEIFQPFIAKPLKKHKDCGGDLQKVFHARGVVFKGSGFYATDSRQAPKDDKAKKEPAAKSNESKDKPAPAKTEAKAPSTSD